jgi:hypothetical protein
MHTRILGLILALALGAALVGCATAGDPAPDVGAPVDDGSTGMRLANGLYDQTDGTVLGLGTLEWIDLEGGFYALTGSPEGDGNIAVIANADEFANELEALVGKTVQITGTRFDGASIRMAGPEVVIDKVEEISDTPGAAE